MHQTKPHRIYQILQNKIQTETSPQSRSSAGWLWGQWRGWYCRAPVPVGPLLLSEAPCLQYHTTPLSIMLGSLTLPQQPVAKICHLTTHITTALTCTNLTFQAETHFIFFFTPQQTSPVYIAAGHQTHTKINLVFMHVHCCLPFHFSCCQMFPASLSMPHSPWDSSQSLLDSSETSRKGMACLDGVLVFGWSKKRFTFQETTNTKIYCDMYEMKNNQGIWANN